MSDDSGLFCPSAQPDLTDGVVFGVIGGTAEEPRVSYLAEPLPVTPELLALAEPAHATEVFRMGAPCAREGCQHYDGSRCNLVRQIIAGIPVAVEAPPPCRLRPRCRWWHQEGPAACVRCPLVATEQPNPTEAMALAAQPSGEIVKRRSKPNSSDNR
jgi:hypothetical protein